MIKYQNSCRSFLIHFDCNKDLGGPGINSHVPVPIRDVRIQGFILMACDGNLMRNWR